MRRASLKCLISNISVWLNRLSKLEYDIFNVLKNILKVFKEITLVIGFTFLEYKSLRVMFNIIFLPFEFLRRFVVYKLGRKSLGFSLIFFVPQGLLLWPLRAGDEYFGLLNDIFMCKEYDVPIDDVETVVDVGAHVGFYTLYVAKIVGAGNILALEPEPQNFKFLLFNINLNRVKAYVYPLALFKDGLTKLFVSRVSMAHSVAEGGKGVKAINVHSISLRTLVDLCYKKFKVNRIDVIKLDIEGAELSVIRDNIDVIKKRIVRSFFIDAIDVLRHHGINGLKEIITIFSSAGYEVRLKRCLSGDIVLVAVLKKNLGVNKRC